MTGPADHATNLLTGLLWNLVIKVYMSNRNRLGGRSSRKMSCSSQLLWRSKLLLSVGPEGQETVRKDVKGIGPAGKWMLADRTGQRRIY
jgi:hypothetical protein